MLCLSVFISMFYPGLLLVSLTYCILLLSLTCCCSLLHTCCIYFKCSNIARKIFVKKRPTSRSTGRLSETGKQLHLICFSYVLFLDILKGCLCDKINCIWT